MSFHNVPDKDCATVAKDVAEHARSKWTTAEKLAINGEYPVAIAVKILSLEEYSKALLLYVDSRGFRFRKLKAMKALDRSHRQRHALLLFIAMLGSFGQLMNELVRWLATNDNGEAEDECEVGERVHKELPGLIGRLRTEIVPAMEQLTKSYARLDRLKQLALYTEFGDALVTPLHIGVADFVQCREVLDRAQIAVEAYLGWFEADDPHLNRALQHLERRLQSPEDYRRLNEFIETNFTRANPFETVMAFLRSMNFLLAVSTRTLEQADR